jgi:hypothetical protein
MCPFAWRGFAFWHCYAANQTRCRKVCKLWSVLMNFVSRLAIQFFLAELGVTKFFCSILSFSRFMAQEHHGFFKRIEFRRIGTIYRTRSMFKDGPSCLEILRFD